MTTPMMTTRSTHVRVRSWRTERLRIVERRRTRSRRQRHSAFVAPRDSRLATSPLALELGHNTNTRRRDSCDYQRGSGERALLCARRLTILRCKSMLHSPSSFFTSSVGHSSRSPPPTSLACSSPFLSPFLSLSPSESFSLSRCLSVTHALTLSPDY